MERWRCIAVHIRIEVRDWCHRPLLRDFRNQHDSLVDYLKRYAVRHAENDPLARTFLAIEVSSERERLAGYFTLATASVERASISPISALDRLPRFPIPAVLLARLAVDERAQGQGRGWGGSCSRKPWASRSSLRGQGRWRSASSLLTPSTEAAVV